MNGLTANKHINIELIDDQNIFEWKAVMIGPKGTPYYKGKYILHIELSQNYPFHEIKSIRFKTKIHCCNVSDDGFVSTDLFGNNWTTNCSIKQFVQSIYEKCFMGAGDYNFNCVLNPTMNRLLYRNTQQFVNMHKEFVPNTIRFHNYQCPNTICGIASIVNIIFEHSLLSLEIIKNYLILFCFDEGLHEFIQKFANKQKHQDNVLSNRSSSQTDFVLNVQTMNGEIERLKVNGDDFIYYLKQLLAMKLKTPLKQQLLYKNKQLDDGKTLRDYNLTSNCTGRTGEFSKSQNHS